MFFDGEAGTTEGGVEDFTTVLAVSVGADCCARLDNIGGDDDRLEL